MLDHPASASFDFASTPVLSQKLVQRCHILLPDTPKPISAIFYQGKYYSFIKVFPSAEAAQRAVERSVQKGNSVVLTQVPKGLVLWVLEPDAKLA